MALTDNYRLLSRMGQRIFECNLFSSDLVAPLMKHQRSRRAPPASKPPPAVRPKRQAVLDEIRTRLESGFYPVGSILPREQELCAEFVVSRYSLRDALDHLERQGFIERRRRAGTRVLTGTPRNVFRHAAGSPGDMMNFIKGTARNLSSPRLIRADGRLARLLGCDEMREWHMVDGLRIDVSDKKPIGVIQIYVDPSRVRLPENSDFGNQAVFQWIGEHQNIRTAIISQDITAVLLSVEEATILGERVGAPALRVVRRYFDEQQRMFEIAVTVHRSEDFVYNTRIRLD